MNKKAFTWTQIALVIIGLAVVVLVIVVFIAPLISNITAPGPPKACCTNCINCAEQDCKTCTDCKWENNKCIEKTT